MKTISFCCVLLGLILTLTACFLQPKEMPGKELASTDPTTSQVETVIDVSKESAVPSVPVGTSEGTQNKPTESTQLEPTISEPSLPPSTTTNVQENIPMKSQRRLFVLGQELPQSDLMEFSNEPIYVMLPFCAVFRALGAEAEWVDEAQARIVFDGVTYHLDTESVSLTKEGSSANYILPAPGSRVYAKTVAGEFLLDDITLRTVAMIMGITLKMNIDMEAQVVAIDFPA